MSINTLTQNFVNQEREILLKFFPNGIIAMDLETTGLSPLVDKIIEISAVKVTHDGITTFSELVNPEIIIPENTIDIHGITDEMVKDSRKIKDVLPDFLEFSGDLPFIAHNAQFDMGYIIFNIHQLNLTIPNNEAFCSCKFSRKVFKESENHKLQTITETLGIKIENYHRALDDAYASLRVFAKGLIRAKDWDYLPSIMQDINIFNLNSFKDFEDFKIPKHLRGLEEMVNFQEYIEIKYSGGSHGNKFRPVKATSLLPLPGGNVLYGQCLLSDIYKSFLLKKITDWRIIDPDLVMEILKNSDI